MTSEQNHVIALRHPEIALLVETGRGVVDTFVDVVSGDWTAIVDLCAHEHAGAKIVDETAARVALDAAAKATGYEFAARETIAAEISERMEGDAYLMSGREGVALNALDLFARLLCGQWSEADFVACLAANATHRAPGWDPYSLNSLRQQVCRSRNSMQSGVYRPLQAHEFPDHPQASIGIAESVMPAKIAYHAYKLLGGGAMGGPTFSLRGAALMVEVDGVAVNRIKEYR